MAVRVEKPERVTMLTCERIATKPVMCQMLTGRSWRAFLALLPTLHRATTQKVRPYQPKQKPPNGELRPEEQASNQAIARKRVRIERHIGAAKGFHMAGDVLRNRRETYVERSVETACGLHNLRCDYRLSARAESRANIGSARRHAYFRFSLLPIAWMRVGSAPRAPRWGRSTPPNPLQVLLGAR